MSLGAVKLENKLGFNKMLMCTTSYLSINLGQTGYFQLPKAKIKRFGFNVTE